MLAACRAWSLRIELIGASNPCCPFSSYTDSCNMHSIATLQPARVPSCNLLHHMNDSPIKCRPAAMQLFCTFEGV